MKYHIRHILLILLFAAIVGTMVWSLTGRILPQEPSNGLSTGTDEADDFSGASDGDPGDIPAEQVFDAAGYLSVRFSAKSADTVLSDGVYGDGYSLVLLPKTDAVALADAAPTFGETRWSDDAGSYVTTTDYTLHPYMGYIQYQNGTEKKLLNAEGGILIDGQPKSLRFYGVRDIFGNPLFIDSSVGSLYKVESDGTLTETWYTERTDSRGVSFDYPSYYGTPDDPAYTVYYTGTGFGYKLGDDLLVAPTYKKSYAYSCGFGCASDGEGRLYFFNDEGRLRIGGLAVIMYGCDRNDESALGYYYFDEGLTRVTKRTYQRGQLLSEREVLINRAGEEFPTPLDYTLYSYSCGIMLMQKDGLSGYMNSRGKWITEPVYPFARPFFEGLAVVGTADGKKGMIDRSGAYVIEPVFDEITDCSGGVICVYDKDAGWFVLNKVKAAEQTETEDADTVPDEETAENTESEEAVEAAESETVEDEIPAEEDAGTDEEAPTEEVVSVDAPADETTAVTIPEKNVPETPTNPKPTYEWE